MNFKFLFFFFLIFFFRILSFICKFICFFHLTVSDSGNMYILLCVYMYAYIIKLITKLILRVNNYMGRKITQYFINLITKLLILFFF